MEFSLSYLFLSAQAALLDVVTPSLRAVTIGFDQKKNILNTHFYYDGEISEELFNLVSCAICEIEINLPIFYNRNKDFASRVDYPQKIFFGDRLIYLRNESPQISYEQEAIPWHARKGLPLIAIMLLYLQEALLGKISSNLRLVSAYADKETETLGIYFYYNGEISNHDFVLASRAVDLVSQFFPGYTLNKSIERVDFPNKIIAKGERIAYSRNEG